MRQLKFIASAILILFAFTACSGLFLFPDHFNYFPQVREKVVIDEGEIPTPDHQKLHYWIVPAQKNKTLDEKPKGLIILCHGNAQNLSAHDLNLGWITEFGYSLAIFDYRGFGRSTGRSDLFGAYRDVATALDFFTTEKNPQRLPVFFYGQSLGGTLLLKTVSTQPRRWSPKMVVIESSFFSYPQIGSEKLAQFWLTWPVQWLSYVLITGRLNLKAAQLERISPTPVALYYSEHDSFVPLHNGQEIYAALKEPKQLITFPEPGHTAAMYVEKGRLRKTLLDSFAAVSGQ